jgi:hypothetical protein
VPQAPFGPLQVTNRLIGDVRVGGARAEAAGRLQCVFEAYRGMSPVEHHRGMGQRLALQPPQPGIAVAQHRRWRVRLHASRRERVGCGHWTVPDESKAMLDTTGVDHLARYHLKMALLLSMPTADIAAISPTTTGSVGGVAVCCAALMKCGRTTASPTHNVLFRTVLAFCAPLIGSNSDSSAATLPNDASAA